VPAFYLGTVTFYFDREDLINGAGIVRPVTPEHPREMTTT